MKRVYICAPDCGDTARDWKQITKYIKYALARVVPSINTHAAPRFELNIAPVIENTKNKTIYV